MAVSPQPNYKKPLTAELNSKPLVGVTDRVVPGTRSYGRMARVWTSGTIAGTRNVSITPLAKAYREKEGP